MARRLGVVLLAFLALGSATATAQTRGGGPMMGGGPLGMMPRLQSYMPVGLLQRADELGLTEAQIADLRRLDDQLAAVRNEAQEQHHRARQNLTDAVSTNDPDLDVTSAAFWAAHAAMGRLHWIEIETGLKSMDVLTQEQRSIVDGSRASSPSMGQHHHGRSMPGH